MPVPEAPAVASTEPPSVIEEPPPMLDEAPPDEEPPPDDAPIAEPRAARAETPPPAALHLEMSESEDEDADRTRLASLFRLLQEKPGPERVTLTIHTRGGETIDLALPSTQLDEALRVSLQAAASETVGANSQN